MALDRLWRSCRDYLRLAAAKELAPELRAKVSPSDVVQDTLTAAQENLHQFRGQSNAELHGWLRAILHRELVKAQRRFVIAEKRDIRREVALDAAAVVPGADAAFQGQHATPCRELVSKERAAILNRTIEGLSQDYRRVVIERAYQRRSFADIARDLGRSEAAVRKLWLRGLEQLAREWPADDSQPLE